MAASTSPCHHDLTIALPDEAATRALGAELALFVGPGDRLLLRGDLGSGKSTLARALIHALAPDLGPFEVPSPTFTLVQTYEFTRIPAVHVDLYRIGDPVEVDELGLDELAEGAVMLIEWPDRLPGVAADRLDIHLKVEGAGRVAVLRGLGGWTARLARFAAARDFISGWCPAGACRRFMQGDASSRRYERVACPGKPPAILMDMPARSGGRPVRGGRGYDELAHLARDAGAVYAIATVLRERGYSAPDIHAHDLPRGLMLLEDLGAAVFGDLYRQGEMRKPLAAATDLLADMATRGWPRAVALPGGGVHEPADYDDDAFLIEAELLLDWYWPHLSDTRPDDTARTAFTASWRALLPRARVGQPVWVLRDYHSPNLIWLAERDGLKRVGLIDTQDAVLGPAAYDLASLLQDARFTIPAALEEEMLARYLTSRRAADADFDDNAFRAAYAIMAAQRASKVLGIFARLAMRDRKPAYLAHIPRVRHYLRRTLKHPALAPLAAWFTRHFPHGLKEE
ncbi:MAG TPA: tRNA (adenosine(37)-N6)-threonylcarbamoyltransferase complex ATPase subunit type 1 TsaE [Thermopetrobacter sp.]|nr:tRNA (adenosine(37)-N6)-threonylcarbamoyltransferase complex ATPase subunit type 1 TsaE [Thermopetrobacter sp.]